MQDTTGNHTQKEHILLEIHKILSPSFALQHCFFLIFPEDEFNIVSVIQVTVLLCCAAKERKPHSCKETRISDLKKTFNLPLEFKVEGQNLLLLLLFFFPLQISR